MKLVKPKLETELKPKLPTCVRYNKDFVSIKAFVKQDDIDLNPVHQRPDVGDMNKKRGIIQHLINGLDIGQITLNDAGENYCRADLKYRYESLDGGHRKRAIIEFVEGKFSLFDADILKTYQKQKDNSF